VKSSFTLALLIVSFAGCNKNVSTEPPPPLPATSTKLPSGQPTGKLPPGHPPTVAGKVAPTASKGHVRFQAPPEWKAEKPDNSMRRAQYRMPAKDGKSEAATLAVFHFPGSGGGVLGNLKRWYGQFKSPPQPKEEKRKVGGMDVTVAYATGIYMLSSAPMAGGKKTEKPNWALLAAIAHSPSGPWFFKVVGPKETVDFHRARFDALVNSFTVAGEAKKKIAPALPASKGEKK